jgi:hypothetical protein
MFVLYVSPTLIFTICSCLFSELSLFIQFYILYLSMPKSFVLLVSHRYQGRCADSLVILNEITLVDQTFGNCYLVSCVCDMPPRAKCFLKYRPRVIIVNSCFCNSHTHKKQITSRPRGTYCTGQSNAEQNTESASCHHFGSSPTRTLATGHKVCKLVHRDFQRRPC